MNTKLIDDIAGMLESTLAIKPENGTVDVLRMAISRAVSALNHYIELNETPTEQKYCDPNVPCLVSACPFPQKDGKVPCYEPEFMGGINKYNCPHHAKPTPTGECPACKIRPGGIVPVDDDGNCRKCGKFFSKIHTPTPTEDGHKTDGLVMYCPVCGDEVVVTKDPMACLCHKYTPEMNGKPLPCDVPTPAPLAVEPLAVLCQRKGYYVTGIWPWSDGFGIEVDRQFGSLPKPETTPYFFAPTYALAEASARAFLEKLEDKGETK